jgi:dihydrofolate synthase/folylpolyglutamate synthase
MNATEWLLQNYGQEQLKLDPGLDRIRSALSHLLPDLRKIPVITIAGTNGKGETTMWLSRYLTQKKRCVWMSPHIERITERMSSEAGEIDLQELTTLIFRCHEELRAKGSALSYYEFLFYVFCTWAHERKPEVLLLEVGLGGRLDAVNVFDAKLVLLPSISRDHQEFLGNRYDLILGEKLGLLRNGSTLLSFLSLEYLRERAQKICDHMGSNWLDLDELSLFENYEFSGRNQLLAYAASKFLSGTPLSELKLKKTYTEWKPREEFFEHRGEHFVRGAEYVFFGSHNVDGMRKLIQFLQSDNYTFKRRTYDAVVVAFSKRDERDLRILLKMLKTSSLGPVTVTTFPHPKAMGAEMAVWTLQEGLNFVRDIRDLIKELEKNSGTPKSVLVTGSYYFMGYFKSLLRGR